MGRFELILFALPIVVLLVGALAGSVIERRHLASLARREELPGPILTDLGAPPAGVAISDARLVSGEAVLGADRGKEFVSRRCATSWGGKSSRSRSSSHGPAVRPASA